MARYDGELKAAQEVGLNEVFPKRPRTSPAERARQDAIACYHSGGEGWREALKLLGGAFAPEGQTDELELTGGKAD